MTYQLLNSATPAQLLTAPDWRFFCTCLMLALSTVVFSTPAAADTYTWLDEKGVVNYSERMPRGIPPHRVSVVRDNVQRPSSDPTPPLTYTPPQPAREASPPASDQEDLSEEQQQMLAELQAAEEQRLAKVAEVRRDNCERARRVLENLSNVGRVRVVADDGTRSVLPEEERSRRIAEAQRGVATNC